jgi:hypothetical protein
VCLLLRPQYLQSCGIDFCHSQSRLTTKQQMSLIAVECGGSALPAAASAFASASGSASASSSSSSSSAAAAAAATAPATTTSSATTTAQQPQKVVLFALQIKKPGKVKTLTTSDKAICGAMFLLQDRMLCCVRNAFANTEG